MVLLVLVLMLFLLVLVLVVLAVVLVAFILIFAIKNGLVVPVRGVFCCSCSFPPHTLSVQ